MSAPKKNRSIPLFWPPSQSGDSRSERALKAGNLPPTLEPTAIPRREPPPTTPRFNRIPPTNSRPGGSSAGPLASSAGSSSAARNGGPAGAARSAAVPTKEGGNAVASSSTSARPAATATTSGAAQGSGRPSMPAAASSGRPPQPVVAAGPREPLFHGGPEQTLAYPPRPTPVGQQPRHAPVASTSTAGGSSFNSNHNSHARRPVCCPPQPPTGLQMSLPFERAPPPPPHRPNIPAPASTSNPAPVAWSSQARPVPRSNGAVGRPPPTRPFIAAGPKAAVPFPYPQMRRESLGSGSGSSSPANGNPYARPPQPPKPAPSDASAGLSTRPSAASERPAVHDAVPLAEHEALLSRPNSRTSDRSEVEQQQATAAITSVKGSDDSKGKAREVVTASETFAAVNDLISSRPPFVSSSDHKQRPSAEPSARPVASDEQATVPSTTTAAPSAAVQVEAPERPAPRAEQLSTPAPPSTLPPPLPPSALPPPPPLPPQALDPALKPATATGGIAIGSSDDSDDDDVEAALLEAQRKLAELQEKKRLKALRKSLGSDEQRSDVSQSPAPASAAAPIAAPERVPKVESALSTTAPASTLALPAKTSLPTTHSTSAPSPVNPPPPPLQQPSPPPPPQASADDKEPLPMAVDSGPQPFGTPSQVVFSDLPIDTKELALRRFIGGTLVSVKHVDFQEAFALVTFSNPHDAAEVVRMLSDEDFLPGQRIAIDLASNLELVNEPVEPSDQAEPIVEPEVLRPQSAYVSPAKPPPSPPQIDVKPLPSSPHNSLFSSQRHSLPPPNGPVVARRQSSATSVDEALDEPVWAAKKRRRVGSSPQQLTVQVKEENEPERVVDLTLSSDDERQTSTSKTVSPAKVKASKQPKESAVAKRVKYGPPEVKLYAPKKLTAPRQPNTKTRWITVGEQFYACAYHKGVVEFFDKKTLDPRPTVHFEMAEGESVEGIAFAGNRLIVGRQRRNAEELRPQISWVSTSTLRKNKAERVRSGTIDDQAHSGMGVSCCAALPSTALTAETTLSTSVYATGGFDHAVKLWKFDDDSRRKLWALHSTDHTSRVDALIWDDQKKWLYSAGADGRILGFALAKAKMSDWVLPRSTTGVYQLHLSTAHPALLLAETNRVNQQFSLYDTRSSPTRQPVMFGDGESGSGAGTDGSSKGRSKYVRGSWQKNLFASADQRGNLRIWDVRYLKSCYTVEIQAAATANRQVVLDGDRLLDLTGEALFSREWRLM